MTELLHSLVDLVLSIIAVLHAVVLLARPLLPLLAWMAFWYLAVDWKRLRATLGAGGWVAPVLVAGFAVVIRVVSTKQGHPPMPFGPTTISPVVAGIAWTSLLAALAMICGAAQISRNAARADTYEI